MSSETLELPLRHRSTSVAVSVAVVNVVRPIFTQTKFDELYRLSDSAEEQNKAQHTTSLCCRKCLTSAKVKVRQCLPSSFSTFLLKIFPFVSIMGQYNWRQDGLGDLIAGATVTFIHVPQALAYGKLATLRPIHGLYVAIFPSLIYFFLGTSRHLSIGVFAVASLMVAKVLDAEIASSSYGLKSQDNNETMDNITSIDDGNITSKMSIDAEELRLRVEIAASYNLVVGAMQLILGIIGAGSVTNYLNEPFISGYTTACACHVMTSQLWLAIGVKGARHSGYFKIILTYRDLFWKLPEAHWVTFGIFIASLAVLVVWKEVLEPLIKRKFKIPIPMELILIMIVDGISYAIGLSPNYKVPIVGSVPSDFPVPMVPRYFRLNYILDSIPIVLVSFSVCISMGKMLAKKAHYHIDPNQEFMAIGSSNIFASFFSCYPSTTAMSRTLVQANVGGKTQVASLVSSSLILVVILFLGRFLEPLPTCILAAIVIVNLKGMFVQVADIPRYWRLCKMDAITWLISFFATVLVDVDVGLYVGVAFVLVTVIFQTGRTRFAFQHQVKQTELFTAEETSTNNLSPTLPVVVLSWSSPLYFANVEQLEAEIVKIVHPTRSHHGKQKPAADSDGEAVQVIILDLSGALFVDAMGIEFFKETIAELA